MRNLGTFQTDTGYSYDVNQNPLLMHPLKRTTVAPFGRPVVQDVAPAGVAEYATAAAASAFAAVLKSRGAAGIAPAEEAATFVTDLNGEGVPKWEIVFPETQDRTAIRVNAGVIASILGDDTVYGYDARTKAGPLSAALVQKYDPSIHIPLIAQLRAAVGA